MMLELSDGTMREVCLRSDSNQIAKSNFEESVFGFFPSDLALFLIYLNNLEMLNGDHSALTGREVLMLANILPTLLLGKWVEEPIPSYFLDRPIKAGLYIIDIWDITLLDCGSTFRGNAVLEWLANGIADLL